MTIQKLMILAPFMTREAAETAALAMEEPMTLGQIRGIAPFLRPEGLEKLLQKNGVTGADLEFADLLGLARHLPTGSADRLIREYAYSAVRVPDAQTDLEKVIRRIRKAMDRLCREFCETAEQCASRREIREENAQTQSVFFRHLSASGMSGYAASAVRE